MATVIPVATYPEKGVVKVIWERVTGADTGQAITVARYSDKTITVTGTYDSATLVIEGSNDGSTFQTLEDTENTACSFTTGNKMFSLRENPLYLRCSTSGGGASADLDVIVVGRA